MKSIFILGIAYFFICLCIYSAHNYMLKIISGETDLTAKEYSILDMLLFIKFIGAFFWTNIADRTKRHKLIIVLGLMGYAIFFSAFKFAPEGFVAKKLNFFTIFYRSLSIFFLSSVFATMDSLTLEYLDQIGKVRQYYGRLKLFSCAGHALAHICVKMGEARLNPAQPEGTASIYLTLMFAVLGSIWIYASFGEIETVKIKRLKKIESLSVKLRRNFKYIGDLLTLNLWMLIISITMQGIHRQSITKFLEKSFNSCNIKKGEIATVFASRCIPEAFMLFCTPYIEKLIGVHSMLFMGIVFGVIRPIAYAFVEMDKYTHGKRMAIAYGLELSKGVFSALFGYSGSKLVKELSTPKTRSLAQGIFNGCYSGLAPFISGLLGYYFLETDRFKIRDNDIRGLFFMTGMIGVVGMLICFVLIFVDIRDRRRMKVHIVDEVSMKGVIDN